MKKIPDTKNEKLRKMLVSKINEKLKCYIIKKQKNKEIINYLNLIIMIKTTRYNPYF